MKSTLTLLLLIIASPLFGQEVDFVEYDLENGLHVILHQDNKASVVVTSVLYHVGSKDEKEDRTGFAHFFEHLLFEGTQNIERGKWFTIVTANGGKNNAYTTDDFTYYYEVFPSNNLELGLWLESERMLHLVINKIGVETQNEVVKEEKRLRYDNSPYGNWLKYVRENLFKNHPYSRMPIGKMEHPDAATLEEFKAFNKKYYSPNNAVLVVAGNFDLEKTKKMVTDYFGTIPRGETVARKYPKEAEVSEAIETEAFDENIQVPALFTAYKIPDRTTRESKILDMVSTYLSDGNSSVLYRKLVDEQKMFLQVAAFNISLEDHGMYVILTLPQGENSLVNLRDEIDEEIMGNSQTSTVKFGDFKQVNGIYFPHTTTLSMGPQAIDFKSTGIELNTTIDASLFE